MPFTYATHPSLAHRLVSRAAFLEYAASQGRTYHNVVVGAAIFRPAADGTQPLVLVVRRAAHEKFLPNHFELPGGHVEAADVSILDAVARETLEETGLVVREVVGELAPFEYSVHTFAVTAGDPAIGDRRTIQLNFVVRVAPGAVTLNPDEHADHAWVDRDGLRGCAMTEAMRAVVLSALDWVEANAALLGSSG